MHAPPVLPALQQQPSLSERIYDRPHGNYSYNVLPTYSSDIPTRQSTDGGNASSQDERAIPIPPHQVARQTPSQPQHAQNISIRTSSSSLPYNIGSFAAPGTNYRSLSIPVRQLHNTHVTRDEAVKKVGSDELSRPVPDAALNELDHRAIGKAQALFMIHPHSPGSIFMLPHGTRIVQKLQDFLRKEYSNFGYDEVMTPLIYKKELWETSGHWQNYMEDMFMVRSGREKVGCQHGEHDDEEGNSIYGLKPMNCPGHCLIFDSTQKSYRDLPIRLADFSPLHRNEASGALTGLTRVRRFHQDDAHIFCTEGQITSEISSCLNFVDRVYNAFRFPHYDLTLSTRPESNYIGSINEWDNAENALKQALDSTQRPWSIKEGDGAFYGPKIDIMVKDSSGRSHQTATIQLDFQLPQRFDLKYADENDHIKTPVIIHRAILGSVERMMAILIEHTGGKWPFWLSPRQGMVMPVASQFSEYASKVAKELSLGNGSEDRYFVDVDTSPRDRLNKKIRLAQQQRYNFIFVVGQKEQDSGTVNVRTRDGEILGTKSLEEVRHMFSDLTSKLA
ncbi:54S ribosomal protein L39, mitochondrial [Apophysomyces sp. BC1034]|nr:54S ribosomal protein L39, mitochondrial [Apophysomyces sp. BC1015]KAG0178916.1 54S ribosomal protein L39, mitochondrial [Apophysomyces sp. BC1021]KAG0188048.1 54S ribosomal protein L39, mitochondrial [Apophysomyces sp. BC1034]